MRSFRHRRGRILFEIFGALLIGSIGAERWVDRHSIFGLMAAVGLGCYGLYRISALFVRDPALAFGDKGVQVGGFFAVKDYRWAQVREISEAVWKRPYIPFMHWLPKERHYLKIDFDGSSVKLRPEMMELPAGGAKEVIASFRAAQVSALGERGAAMARLGAKEGPASAAPASVLQAERWGRLGLGESSSEEPATEPPAPDIAPPGIPQRPVFGRKVS